MPRIRRPHLIAALLLIAAVTWMASGLLLDGSGKSAPQHSQARSEAEAVLVETRSSDAIPIELYIVTHGEALPQRRVVVRAEAAGRVRGISVREGERVVADQPLIQLSLEARESRRAEAEANLRRLRRELGAARQLERRGVATPQRVRQLEAETAAAEAALARVREEIDDTTIGAPFAGIVNNVAVEPGEYVAVGGEVATVIDNDPLHVAAEVSQQAIGRVKPGAVATVRFATGRAARGRICFVSAAANPETRTFTVEIRVANPGNETPSGVSAEARIPTGTAEAHKVSPAILSLGPAGDLGIKTVVDGHVVFRAVEILRGERNGVWIAGIPRSAQIITLGQGFVQQGQPVRVAEAREPLSIARPNRSPPSLSATTSQALRHEEAAAPTGTSPPDCGGGQGAPPQTSRSTRQP